MVKKGEREKNGEERRRRRRKRDGKRNKQIHLVMRSYDFTTGFACENVIDNGSTYVIQLYWVERQQNMRATEIYKLFSVEPWICHFGTWSHSLPPLCSTPSHCAHSAAASLGKLQSGIENGTIDPVVERVARAQKYRCENLWKRNGNNEEIPVDEGISNRFFCRSLLLVLDAVTKFVKSIQLVSTNYFLWYISKSDWILDIFKRKLCVFQYLFFQTGFYPTLLYRSNDGY